MQGFTRPFAFCLALGILTTIVIAWTCAALVPLSTDPPLEERFVDSDGTMVWRIVQESVGRSRINYIHGPSKPFGAHDNELAGLVVPLLDALSILRPEDAGSIEKSGWPFAALCCRSNQLALDSDTMSFTISMTETKLEGGILLSSSAANQPWQALPYQPIWIGLMLDVVVFAGAWMALLYVPAPIRARLRRLRGRCPMCGYDLRGQRAEVRDQKSEVSGPSASAGCPECGWGRGHDRQPEGLEHFSPGRRPGMSEHRIREP